MSSLYRSILSLVLVPCLLLTSCASRTAPQPPVPPPVPSAELQAAFQGPLCTRLNGVEWPCSDTDGRLWNEWDNQQTDYRHQQHRQAIGTNSTGPSVGQVAAGVAVVAGVVLLVGTLGVLTAMSRNSSYGYHSYNTITTRCSYGTYRSSCTTRY